MSPAAPLGTGGLRRVADSGAFEFASTAELEDLPPGWGQQRAEEALRLGLRIAQPGYNIFVLGPDGYGRRALVSRVLGELAAQSPRPPDLCYRHDFSDPLRPKLLCLAAGRGAELRARMRAFVCALVPEIARTRRAADPRDELRAAIDSLLDPVRRCFLDETGVQSFLAAVAVDALEYADGRRGALDPALELGSPGDLANWHRYQVCLVVDNSAACGAPVVFEDHPGRDSLSGRVAWLATRWRPEGAVQTIQAGALHRAHGGYLVIDAARLCDDPLAWEALRRALRSGCLRVAAPAGPAATGRELALEPEPLAGAPKVVLIGDQDAYQALDERDPEFLGLFRITCEFDEDLPRTEPTERLYARLAASVARSGGLKPVTAAATAKLVELAARRAEDAHRLSLEIRWLADLLREADLVAADAGAPHIGEADIARVLEARRRRSDRFPNQLRESMLEGTLRIDTSGEVVGQVNGLVLADLGGESFGFPVRITAGAWVGEGDVIDIEREADLGGPLHSKGVMILSAFLAARYARRRALSLCASLVFEQSYDPVEGDSASLGELCALLSTLAELPVRQSLAVTGSVDQHGRVQAIGGVNEKIEGFYELCAARAPSAGQGVVIPAANLRHLMLREDVVAAVAAGRFHIYAADSVDDAIEILTGVPAGRIDRRGLCPRGSVNDKVARALEAMAAARQPGGDSGLGGAVRPHHERVARE